MVMAITGRQSLPPLLFVLSTLLHTFTLAQDGSQHQQKYRAAFGILDARQDTTCPGGGVCDLGNVCCGVGCMFSSGNCCGGDYFCYVGETCQGPDDVGDVNCCIDGSCTPAKYVILYASGGSGSASATAAPSSTVESQTGQSQASTIGTSAGVTSQVQSTSPSASTAAGSIAQSSQTAATTSAAGNSATTSSAPASTTSKSAGARLTHGLLWQGALFSILTLMLPPLLMLVLM